MKSAIAGALGRAARPLVFYYGIAVAVPVLNGATLDREFLEHVAFVVVVPLAIVMAATGSNWLLRRNGGRRTMTWRAAPRARLEMEAGHGKSPGWRPTRG
jgi:hypothetical protein